MSDQKKMMKATLEELHYDKELAVKLDQFKAIVNTAPPDKWVKKNAYANNSKYVPIGRTELLLDIIFQQWKVEGLREGTMFNSVYAVIRLHYVHPVTGEWMFHDGYGAKALQVNASTSEHPVMPSDMREIKSEAVMMALPMAVSYAIKDACDHIGKLFGRDLNRKDQEEFEGKYSKPEPPKDKSLERILKVIESCKTKSELINNLQFCSTVESKMAYDNKFKELT